MSVGFYSEARYYRTDKCFGHICCLTINFMFLDISARPSRHFWIFEQVLLCKPFYTVTVLYRIFDISASKENNILKFSAVKIIDYFLPKAFVGTVREISIACCLRDPSSCVNKVHRYVEHTDERSDAISSLSWKELTLLRMLVPIIFMRWPSGYSSCWLDANRKSLSQNNSTLILSAHNGYSRENR
jgi:hypothetical protein